ncbi:hypothetical protein PIN31115_03133 [Pandoraea iniqua]|uniref:Uncharacterized protein n=2 Tax=Pandoraea iniqua TaxID=2508288 RepID=A0A5E4W874_9BURK|nr:hypothetical protein PIN31115_03133 [Pandoraea iniqua]
MGAREFAMLSHQGDDWLPLMATPGGERDDAPPMLVNCTYALVSDAGVDAFYWPAGTKADTSLPLDARRLSVPKGPFGTLMSLCNTGAGSGQGWCKGGPGGA